MNSNLVCRTCLQLSIPESCQNVEEDEHNLEILEMLSYSIPEMVIKCNLEVINFSLCMIPFFRTCIW